MSEIHSSASQVLRVVQLDHSMPTVITLTSCVVYQKWSLLSQLLGMVLAITLCSSLVECKNCYPAYVVYRTLTTLYNTIGTLLCLQIAQQPFITQLTVI